MSGIENVIIKYIVFASVVIKMWIRCACFQNVAIKFTVIVSIYGLKFAELGNSGCKSNNDLTCSLFNLSFIYNTIHTHSEHCNHDLISTSLKISPPLQSSHLGLTLSFSGRVNPTPHHSPKNDNLFPYILSLYLSLSIFLLILLHKLTT